MISKVTLFCFGAVLTAVAIYVAGVEGAPAVGKKFEMVGHYKLDSDQNNPEMKKFLENTKVDEMIVKAIMATKKLIVSFRKVNATHFSIIKIAKQLTIELTFESGKEFVAELPDGREAKNVITVDEEKHTVSRNIKVDGIEANCVSQFTEKGIETTMTAGDAKAMIKFKRCDADPKNKEDAEDLKQKYFAD